MKRKREYILIFAITCLSWGLFFPEYTFTTDSYRIVWEDGSEIIEGDELSDAENVEDTGDSETVDLKDVQSAIRDGRVRYRSRFAEYIRSLFF